MKKKKKRIQGRLQIIRMKKMRIVHNLFLLYFSLIVTIIHFNFPLKKKIIICNSFMPKCWIFDLDFHLHYRRTRLISSCSNGTSRISEIVSLIGKKRKKKKKNLTHITLVFSFHAVYFWSRYTCLERCSFKMNHHFSVRASTTHTELIPFSMFFLAPLVFVQVSSLPL